MGTDTLVEKNQVSKGEYLASVVQERDELKKQVTELEKKMSGMVEMDLQYQQYITGPPVPKAQLFGRACSNDTVTVQSWAETWIKYAHENSKMFKPGDNLATKDKHKYALRPGIIAGSGPSLKKNVHLLKERPDIVPLVSCLHNFAFFEDQGVKADYYLNLDSGDVTIPEMSQGGKKDEKYYWDKTKDRTLVTAIHTNPKLIERWQGEVRFFGTIIPHGATMQRYMEAYPHKLYYNVGGNTLGACLYHARAILGCSAIVFVGADFAFGYDKKFHPFDSPYDQQYSGLIPATDVFGNRVHTWQSYYNFKSWMEFIAMGGEGNAFGHFINATEGGILGSYPEGNIMQIQQMPLKAAINWMNLHKSLDEVIEKQMLLF